MSHDETRDFAPFNEMPPGKFLSFHEAVCLIAFGSYRYAARGPRSFGEQISIRRNDRESESHVYGRFELASDMLFSAISTGQIQLFGKLHVDDESIDPKSDNVFFKSIVGVIAPSAIFSEEIMMEDDAYLIGGKWYEVTLVAVEEFERVFSQLGAAQRIESPNGLHPANVTPSPLDIDANVKETRSRGRPRNWNWDDIFAEVAALANMPDGLPETQAELARYIANYCQRAYGKEPSPSLVREKISSIYDRIAGKSGKSTKR